MFTHYGCITNSFFPVKSHGPLAASDLSPTLSPLAPYVGKLLLPRGIRAMNEWTANNDGTNGLGQGNDPHTLHRSSARSGNGKRRRTVTVGSWSAFLGRGRPTLRETPLHRSWALGPKSFNQGKAVAVLCSFPAPGAGNANPFAPLFMHLSRLYENPTTE
jgi:hypothetical protein